MSICDLCEEQEFLLVPIYPEVCFGMNTWYCANCLELTFEPIRRVIE